jgi:inorganic triphosphatase YgiF
MARAGSPTLAPQETELKLRIAPEALGRLARHPLLTPLRRGRSRTSTLVSTYFDTADESLARAGVALRLRRDGKRWVQTVKGPRASAHGAGLSTRTEYEWPVAGRALDPLRFAVTPFRRELGRALRHGVAPRFTTEIRRTTIPLAFADSTHALLCIDTGEVRTEGDGPLLRMPIHEVEIELQAGDPARLFEFAHALAGDVPLALEPASKAERGFALRHPVTPAPVRALAAPLPAKLPAGAAIGAIARNCLAQIEANAPGLLSDDDPEWIHQMRIGVRRLRACLSLARRAFATARVEPVRVELRWLAHALGPARDFDVFSTQTLPAFRAAVTRGSDAAPLDPALRALAARAAARRREARVAARAAVASPRFLRLVLAAGALAAAAGVDVPEGDAHALQRPAREFARPLLKRRHRALLELGTNLAHAAPEARHAARLAAKKLRYAAEFFAPLFAKKRTRSYLKSLAALQEELGAWNDAAVAAQLAGELAGPDAPAAAAFSGWAAALGSARAAALDKTWQAFSAVRPFWAKSR